MNDNKLIESINEMMVQLDSIQKASKEKIAKVLDGSAPAVDGVDMLIVLQDTLLQLRPMAGFLATCVEIAHNENTFLKNLWRRCDG